MNRRRFFRAMSRGAVAAGVAATVGAPAAQSIATRAPNTIYYGRNAAGNILLATVNGSRRVHFPPGFHKITIKPWHVRDMAEFHRRNLLNWMERFGP